MRDKLLQAGILAFKLMNEWFIALQTLMNCLLPAQPALTEFQGTDGPYLSSSCLIEREEASVSNTSGETEEGIDYGAPGPGPGIELLSKYTAQLLIVLRISLLIQTLPTEMIF